MREREESKQKGHLFHSTCPLANPSHPSNQTRSSVTVFFLLHKSLTQTLFVSLLLLSPTKELAHLLSSGARGTLTTETATTTAAATETTAAATVTTEARTVLTVEGRTTLVLDLSLAGLHGVGDDLLRKVKVTAKINDTLLSESPVVPAPVESLLDIAAALEGLHELDELPVANLADEVVLGGKEILLCNHHTLTEKVSVDDIAVLLGNDHLRTKNTTNTKQNTKKNKQKKVPVLKNCTKK